ncbi:uncharacterized protein LOC130979988 [Arachis stenosperma]|uniref:uncharacterized protein LOC130979988 n=1 Tax=Arachis stenosperma TaxID=217475 RepID=UPI0025AB89AE|nr:uncharacterized protein LOC130979988 [Arachis stenosperma]
MDFMTGLPRTRLGIDAVWVIVDRLTKFAHFLPIQVNYSLEELARLYIKKIVRLHGVPSSISKRTIIQTLDDMLRAYVLDQPGSWDCYMPLAEFTYNNSFHASIEMTPYKALYGRKFQFPLYWYEAGESSVLGPDLVTPTIGIERAIKMKKLKPRFIGPFEILRRFGPVAYQVALLPHLSTLHDVFHVSQLRKYKLDVAHVSGPKSVKLKKNLTFQVTPMRIDDTSVKKLQGKEV